MFAAKVVWNVCCFFVVVFACCLIVLGYFAFTDLFACDLFALYFDLRICLVAHWFKYGWFRVCLLLLGGLMFNCLFVCILSVSFRFGLLVRYWLLYGTTCCFGCVGDCGAWLVVGVILLVFEMGLVDLF